MRIALTSLILFSGLIGGCIGSKCEEECDYPASALTEIATLGATITAPGVPVPVSVDQQYIEGDEPFVTARFNLYFSPSPAYENIVFDVENETIASFSNTTSYEYTFSQNIGGEFQEISPAHTTWDPPGPANQYTSAVRLYSSPEELIVNGNHIIDTELALYFAAPARSTHVELWYRQDANAERELVRRVPLSSFDFWKRYMEPLIIGK